MSNAKFSMNALMIIVIIFSAIGLFFTVKMVNMSNRFPVNEFYAIEDTDLAVKYSSLEPNGIYRGNENNNTLVLEGSFGYEWGAIKSGDHLFLNEYRLSDLGVLFCDLVEVDLNSMEKTVLMEDTILRGQCRSGELVCIKGFIMPTDFPETNSLLKLYDAASDDISVHSNSHDIAYINTKNNETVYTAFDSDINKGDFEARWIDKTLEEVMS